MWMDGDRARFDILGQTGAQGLPLAIAGTTAKQSAAQLNAIPRHSMPCSREDARLAIACHAVSPMSLKPCHSRIRGDCFDYATIRNRYPALHPHRIVTVTQGAEKCETPSA
jgi:hypothetical protein